jgi:F-type H+-transporting ATPase subunit b
MRTRKVAAALLLATVAFFSLAGSAGAQETLPEGKGEAETECIKILAEGGSIDKCQEAPSPITPAKNELIWGIISFTVLLVLLWKFAYPGLKKGMDARTERIASSIDEAESAKTEAQTLLDDYRRQLADARNESGRIIEEARQQADSLKRDQESRLQAELAEMRARAAADIESAKAQAVADLHADVAQIAIGAAEVVVQHNLDADTQTQLIENYINQVGSSR